MTSLLLFFVHYEPVQQTASVMDQHAAFFVVDPKNIKRDCKLHRNEWQKRLQKILNAHELVTRYK